MKKLFFIITISFGLLASPIAKINATSFLDSETTQKIGIGAAVGSVLTLGGYSLYKLGQWFFEKTDSEVYNEAYEYYETIIERYNNLLEIWGQDIYFAHDEDSLSRLCKPIQNVAYSIYTLETSLYKSIQNLDKNKNLLLKRIEKLDKNQDDFSLSMHALVKNITSLKKNLNRIYRYLSKHYAYFELTNLVKDLKEKYKHESTIITDYEKGLLSDRIFNKKLAQCILSNTTNTNFPYIEYINQITENITALNKTLADLKQKYPHISNQARVLRKNLVTIKSLVVLHDNYHTELCEQERNKLEQQKIAQEQQRISLERQRFYTHQLLCPLFHFHSRTTWCPGCGYLY